MSEEISLTLLLVRAANVIPIYEKMILILIIIYYSWNGGRAKAVCAGENE